MTAMAPIANTPKKDNSQGYHVLIVLHRTADIVTCYLLNLSVVVWFIIHCGFIKFDS